MKRLSIFDLQEGKVYAAYDGERLLGKQYRVSGGKLQNADRDSDGSATFYQNCEWIPMKASVTFEEVAGQHAPVSALFLKEGTVYRANNGPMAIIGYVTRTGRVLSYVDEKLKPTRQIDLATVDLNVTFSPVGKVFKRAKAKISKKVSKKISKLLAAKGRNKSSRSHAAAKR